MCVMLIAVLAALLVAQQPETLSLLGDPLYARKLPKAERAAADAALARAHAAYTKNPAGAAEILALYQAHLALGRIGDALIVLTHGVEAHPQDATLLLERGRGYITIRKFEPAARDLSIAARTLPAARCALGLAHYLSGDYPRARATYAECAEPGVFGYLADRRAGGSPTRPPVAAGPAPATAPPIRFPGTVARDKATAREPLAATYLAAAERLLAGDEDGARDRLKQIVERNRNDWMDPAYIAAEADYARLPQKKRRR